MNITIVHNKSFYINILPYTRILYSRVCLRLGYSKYIWPQSTKLFPIQNYMKHTSHCTLDTSRYTPQALPSCCHTLPCSRSCWYQTTPAYKGNYSTFFLQWDSELLYITLCWTYRRVIFTLGLDPSFQMSIPTFERRSIFI